MCLIYSWLGDGILFQRLQGLTEKAAEKQLFKGVTASIEDAVDLLIWGEEMAEMQGVRRLERLIF